MNTDMMRTRMRIWAVLSFFPFMTPTCCMHYPRENMAEAQRAVHVSEAGVSQMERTEVLSDGGWSHAHTGDRRS